MIPKKVGDKSFMQFITKCVMNDWIVLSPVGDCDRYDCVIDRGNGLEKVQVKTGRMKQGSIRFNTSSSHYHTKLGQVTKHFRHSYKGQIDAFGVFCAETNSCYLVPLTDDFPDSQATLRVDPVRSPGSNTQSKLRLARDFQI